jgi:hypothetical protein
MSMAVLICMAAAGLLPLRLWLRPGRAPLLARWLCGPAVVVTG